MALARFLTAENRERAALLDLVRAQARGDARAVDAALDGPCGDRCVALAERLERPGEVKLLRLDSATSYTLGTARGPSRVAWAVVADDQDTVVQCVDVERRGGILSGRRIILRAVSDPIGPQASC